MQTLLKPAALLIDDDASVLMTMRFAMNKLGIECVAVGSSFDFEDALKNRKFDLYCVDLHLGAREKLGGFDLIHRVREERGTQVPVIVISGDDDAAAITHALEIGANDFIAKPFDRDLLAAKLSRYVSSKELDETRSGFLELPEGRGPARLTVIAEVVSVDEIGVKLRSPHLIPKGTAIKLSGAWIEQCAGAQVQPLVTVTNTWMTTDGKAYGAYAEFDDSDTVLLQGVRKWLASVGTTQAAE